ncbi:MAG: polyprenyl synthetase family protein [Actinobacteria bacterium]|nr:polyprenyl synthetase family protein [Actinomycetota bacterium]
MRYSLLAGGKRIRPVLTLATARGRGADPVSVLPTAAALELIHTYSLIHDDLPAIDDDTLRRGRPTCHVAFGEDVAILAGDGLFAEAFNLVLRRQPGGCAAVTAALAEIAAATGVQGMVGGQYMDVAGEADADDDLRVLHALKTGRLIQAAVVCGALLSGAEDVEPYRAFAAELGLLFQIVDDILDETGAEDELGKSVGKDRALDKVTYVSRFGMEEAMRLSDESEARARELLGRLPGDTADLAAVTGFIHDRRR